MKSFARPVRVVFGAADPYLNAGVAKEFHRLFPTSELFLLPNARHYVQVDDPDEVARLVLSVPTSEAQRTWRTGRGACFHKNWAALPGVAQG